MHVDLFFFFFSQCPSACTEEDPLKKCKKTNFGGVCQSECSEGRIQVANCTDGCKCCGCKPKANCLLKKGFCMEKNSAICTGETNNKWCKGKKCTCCIPGELPLLLLFVKRSPTCSLERRVKVHLERTHQRSS